MLCRPMLAATLKDLSDLRFPCLGTPKFDGIRCLKVGGQVITRRWKLVPNEHIREQLSSLPDGVDGELQLPGASFSEVQSAVMSRSGRPDFQLHVFDVFSELPYIERLKAADSIEHPAVVPVCAEFLYSADDFLHYEELCLEQGYEGVVTRDPHGSYKCGRSTMREQGMVKFKRFDDAEATVVSVFEEQENCNPPQLNAFGHIRRPGGSALKVPKGTMGGLVCIMDSGVDVSIGSGFTAQQRRELWENRPIGRRLTFRFQGFGSQGRPRFPRFVGWRDDS